MDGDRDTLLSLVDAARRTLARPADARLLVDGAGPSGEPTTRMDQGVELVDRQGTPLLLCDPHAPLAGAARSGRCATLTLGSGRLRVLLRGRLLPAGCDRLGEREVERVELRLSEVLVRVDGADGLPVPLEEYHRRRDPDLAAYAEALRAHTDEDHAAVLRDVAARLSGAADRCEGTDPQDLVAAAQLHHLDRSGAVLRWVDVDGAHEVRLLFPRPARSCRELGEHLRHALSPHD